MEQLTIDYNIINSCPDIKTKKALAAKYNAISNKSADIAMAITYAARVNRSSRTEFTIEDVKWYFRLNVPERYSNLTSILDEENIAFVNYLLLYFETQLKHKNLWNKVSYTGEALKCGTSIADRTLISRYKNIKRYIDEHTKSCCDKQDELKYLIAKITVELTDFRKEYLTNVAESAEFNWKSFPSQLDALSKKATKLENAKNNHEEELKNESILARIRDVEYNELKKAYNKVCNQINNIKDILKKFNCESWKQHHIIIANDKFDQNIANLADRIKNRGLNIDSLKFEYVTTDPKIFQMVITDGVQKLYARSIIAAEYSEKMIPHLRFIITNIK